jgi:hypothetical protein
MSIGESLIFRLENPYFSKKSLSTPINLDVVPQFDMLSPKSSTRVCDEKRVSSTYTARLLLTTAFPE